MYDEKALRKTVSFPVVDTVPKEFVALHVYTPSSSGNTSFMDKVATLFLYLRSIISDECSCWKQYYH